jgi:hypothetical protein
MEPINGKTYPLWGQFVDKKAEWIGGTMKETDSDCGDSPTEKITDIFMHPNGNDSAMFVIKGETFEWAADVSALSVGHVRVERGIHLCTPWGSHVTLRMPPIKESSLTE